MAGTKIIKEGPLNISQLKIELENIKKRDNELNFRAQKTEEYLQNLKTVDNPNKLVEKLQKLDVPRLKETHIHKIIDLMPSTANELKIILQGYALTVTKENLNKIVETVNEFASKGG